MENDSLNIVINDGAGKNPVSLPIDREQLGKFIASLLGQQQSIEREAYGTFSIDHAWLLHIHALIDQRIHQQNHGSLTAFSATIYYNNDLKRELSSIEAFEHFSETKQISSQGIKLVWTYLISFPGKNIPERQQISLFATAKAPATSTPQDPIRRLISSKHKLGQISYAIHHTERTWGDDLESLLKQELDLVLQDESWFGAMSGLLFALLSMVFLFGGLVIPDLVNSVIQDRQIASIYKHYQDIIALKPTSLGDVGAKLDLVLKAVNPSNILNKVGAGYRVSMIAGGMVMAFWCMFLADRKSPSFVALTPKSLENRNKYLAREKRNYILIMLSFAASILAGVIGNYAYFLVSTNLP